MKKLGIVILNYNGLKDTRECLVSLRRISKEGLEVQIFVVDYSRDPQEAALLNKQFPEVTVIGKNRNWGFAGGNNVGITAALEWGANYVMLLNNDTIVTPDFLENLYTYLDKHSEVGCVSPKIYFAKGFEYHKDRYKESELGKVIWYAGGLIDWENVYASHRGVDEVDSGQFDEVTNTEFISGCCVLIRKEVLEKIGLLKEELFLYWEDTDFSMRVKQAGWKLEYDPKSYLWHKNAGGSGVGSGLHNYFLTRNRLWFGMKYASFRTKLALIRQSLLQLLTADTWTKRGVRDYYLGKMGVGSWK